ncbi:MAG TPA: SH3 domain-containing protein [Roseomonas sp.]|nr:SH3 domain-containing protein [Roseomonas sp.]
MLSRLHTPDSSQPRPGADPAGSARQARPGPQKPELPKPASEATAPQPPLDPALTGEFGPQPATSERRRAILPQARAALQDPALRQAYEAFVRAATDLAEAGMVFEMVHRSAPEGGMAPREPRNLSVAAVPEKGIEKDCHTVVLMGVGFWEFLPGYFYGSERVIEGSRIAMDVGSFRFVESTPSGDAEIIGQTEAGPLAQYMRIDISGDGLVKSLAISNAALGGAFVAAYRAYLEVLAGCPYKMLHPYRQLSAPTTPAIDPAHPAQPQPQRPAPPRAAAPLSTRRSAPERSGHPGLLWAWLAVPPALAAAYLLGVMATGQDSTPAPPPAPPPVAESPPATSHVLPPEPGRAPIAPAPVVEPPATTPAPQGDMADLPLPPPPPPPPPEAAAPQPSPPPAQLQPAPLTLPPASEAPPAAAPPSTGQLGGMWRPGMVTQDSNVRAAPFGGAPILRVVPGGTQVRIIESSEGWLRVALPDGTTLGWIYGGLIQ